MHQDASSHMTGCVVAVWCPYCIGEDFEGCFGGSTEYLVRGAEGGFVAGGRGSAHVFPDPDDARAAGDGFVGDGVWAYRIEGLHVLGPGGVLDASV